MPAAVAAGAGSPPWLAQARASSASVRPRASAAPLAERGLVTVLASDYHWPALFEAPFAMLRRGVLDVAAAWALVSANPAEALGLTDRGALRPGQRGDALVVAGGAAAPRLVAVFVAGELAWIAPGEAARLSAGF
jgi:alpha-D-ribose 1-methylphosphonate 5-triphosphate diphosphatase